MAKEPVNPVRPGNQDVDLEALFAKSFRKVVYYFSRAGIPADEANDLAQETFLRAHRGRSSFRGEANEETWLLEIAKNIFKNRIRDRNAIKNRHIEVPIDTPADDASKGMGAIGIEDERPGVETTLIEREANAGLYDAVRQLPTQRRQCVEYRLRDLKYHEIAALLGISIETVKSHLYQAREALRLALRRPK